MENKVAMTKKIERYLKRIDLLEEQIKLQAQEEVCARKELELRLGRIIAAQREMIVTLQNRLEAESRKKYERNVRALTKFNGE